MLFPIGDDNSTRRNLPLVTWTIIGINVLVYFLLQVPSDAFTYGYSVVPYELTNNKDLDGTFRVAGGAIQLFRGPNPIYLTMLSAMFMHGGLSHLGGNMLYLFIFGDNVEDNMGKVKFTIFYLLTGLLATVSHVLVGRDSQIPSLGASGAIAGVLGAYLVMFPQNSVRVLMFYQVVPVPALIVVGLWGVMQFISGFGSLANAGSSGGVAYMAHVGGFVAGIILCFFFRDRSLTMPQQREVYRTQFSRSR